MTKHPHKPGAFLKGSGGIPALMPQAQRLLELRQFLADLLPGALARSCSVANYKHGKVVVIFAENNAVAAKLKLLSPTLCDRLAQRGVEITGLEIEVQPPELIGKMHRKAAELSAGAAASLAQLATQLPESELKTSIERLAQRNMSKR
jgi:hypothetical protein